MSSGGRQAQRLKKLTAIRTALKQLKKRLEPLSESASLDAQVLLAEVVGKPRAWVLAHGEATLSPEQGQALENAVQRLEGGEPLPYVLGHWEFYGLDFWLTLPASRLREPSQQLASGEHPGCPSPREDGIREAGARTFSQNPTPMDSRVLIPRPETEVLVERALAWLRENPERRSACDAGTGSGCIAVALAVNTPGLQVTATEIAPAALQVAQANACRHGVEKRIRFVQADLLPAGTGQFDLICANLPYIPTEKLRTLEVYTCEPALALDGGPDGLRLIRRLVRQAPAYLTPGGLILLEIEAGQGAAVLEMAREAWPKAAARVYRDLAGFDRVVEISFIHEGHEGTRRIV